MSTDLISETSELVQKDFALDFQGRVFDEVALRDILADHIAHLLETRLEYLFTTLYLMDVSEPKVHEALSLSSTEPANLVIAQLVIDRLKKKAETKLKYGKLEGDDFLEC
jgi:hypothetical protein